MTGQRARTTPASTAGSFAPASGRKNRQTPPVEPPTLRTFRDISIPRLRLEAREEWTVGIRAGDVVCYGEHRREVFVPICEMVVTKVTPTQIVCGDNRFRRSEGMTFGPANGLYANRGLHPSPPQTEDETDG